MSGQKNTPALFRVDCVEAGIVTLYVPERLASGNGQYGALSVRDPQGAMKKVLDYEALRAAGYGRMIEMVTDARIEFRFRVTDEPEPWSEFTAAEDQL